MSTCEEPSGLQEDPDSSYEAPTRCRGVDMKPALLIIDVQKAFFGDPTTTQSLNDAVETINAAIALFREKHLPIERPTYG